MLLRQLKGFKLNPNQGLLKRFFFEGQHYTVSEVFLNPCDIWQNRQNIILLIAIVHNFVVD